MTISIHALLAESDDLQGLGVDVAELFLSTLSLRRATACIMTTTICIALFLSTLSLRRATVCLKLLATLLPISIHALLAESDALEMAAAMQQKEFLSTLSLRRATRRHRGNDRRPVHFYPRSPCGERLGTLRTVSVKKTFLSTLSLRRATGQRN